MIGREEELAEAEGLLEETRLLTILAPGGTGKTRLAIQAAAEHTPLYPIRVSVHVLKNREGVTGNLQTLQLL